MSKIPGPDSVLWRFVAGQPLTGHYRTDAGFFRRGTKLLGRVPAGRWSYLPGWQRSAARLVVTGAVPAVVWQYLSHPSRTLGVTVTVALLVTLWGVWRVWRAWQRHETYRDYVKPLHSVLGPVLGLPPTTRPAEYISVPETFRTREETPAVIRLPVQFNPAPGNRDLVSVAALAKLGLNEDNTDVVFRLVGAPVLELRMAPQPPDRVLWDDCLELMEALEPGHIFVGYGARSKPYIRDFSGGDLVHGGFSVQTGRGKSAAMMAWASQILRADPESMVTTIDPKQSSLPACLVGVPGYRLENDPDDVPAMWSAIFAFESEVIRRRRDRILDPTAEFPLMFLFLDELSELADMTRETWEEIREDPEAFGYPATASKQKRAPVWRSISRILRMSREYGGRVIVFTQRLDNASTGGIGLRDLFGWRGLAGFRKNQWMMLIGTMPVPKSVKRVGRWIYSDGDKEVWVQNVYGTPEQLRDYAMAGRRLVDTQAGHTAIHDTSPGGLPVSVQWEVVGLQAAADYVGMPVGTFRHRRRHLGPIPGEGLQGRSPTWMKADLDNFVSKVDA